MENLNTAFDVAEKYLDIPRMLDPDGKLPRIHFNSLDRIICIKFSLKYKILLLFMLGLKIRFDQYTKAGRKSHHDLRVVLLSCLPRRPAGSQKLLCFCKLLLTMFSRPLNIELAV